MIKPRTCIPLTGYRHMYRSMLRFTDLLDIEIRNLLYELYLGNIDSVIYEGGTLEIIELSFDGFGSFLTVYARPYFTEVQFYKSMEGLVRSINREAAVETTKTAIRQINHLMETVDHRFESIYECSIADPRTSYGECWYRLTVRPTEPTTIFRCRSEALRPQ